MLRRMEDAALFFHLLGALLFVAGIVLAGVAFETARRRERPAEVALLLGLTRLGVLLVVSGGLLCIAGVGLLALFVPEFARYQRGDAAMRSTS